MASGTILIVTEAFDAHADQLLVKLSELGHEPIRLNTDEIPGKVVFSFSNNGSMWNGTIKIQSNGRVIDTNNIRSIWWRRPRDIIFPETLSEEERVFADREFQQFWNGLWKLVNCHWISPPAAIYQASSKMEQLQRAALLGFEVPRTICTTNPDDVLQFYETCAGRMIYKVLTDPLLASTGKPGAKDRRLRATYTTMVGPAELAALDGITIIPCLFQEYVEKKFELRVTVIGNEVFAAQIDSQTHPNARLDWRRSVEDITYLKANLPHDVREKCLQFVWSYGLRYSALDLILTPNERYVFLENNPNGQFIFIEKLVV